MATIENVRVSMHHAWWLRWYLKGLVVACWLTGCAPNEKRLYWWIKHGTKFSYDAS